MAIDFANKDTPQNTSNPDAWVSITPKSTPLFIRVAEETDPATGKKYERWVGETSTDEIHRGEPGWREVRQGKMVLADGRTITVVLREDNTPISPIGDFDANRNDDQDRIWRERQRTANTNQNQAERKITRQYTRKNPQTGKYEKVTEYEDGTPRVDEIDPEISVTTKEIGGKVYSIEVTDPGGGERPTTKFYNLSDGNKEIPALPADPSRQTKGSTHFVTRPDGSLWVIPINPDGSAGKPYKTDIPADAEGKTVTVTLPDGSTRIVEIKNGRAREVYATPSEPKPPAEAGNFVPDPRKPALGLGEYIQGLSALRAASKISDKQYNDLVANAYKTAEAEAKRLDVIVSAQRGAAQDAITQRANDLQASTTRLQSANDASRTLFDTGLKIAGSLTPETLSEAGGDVFGPLMTLQDMRGQAWGGFYAPPPVTPTPGTAYGDIQTQGMTNTQQVNSVIANGPPAPASAAPAPTPTTPGTAAPVPAPSGPAPSAPAPSGPTAPPVVNPATGDASGLPGTPFAPPPQPPASQTDDNYPIRVYNPQTGEWRQITLRDARAPAYDGWQISDPYSGTLVPIRNGGVDPPRDVPLAPPGQPSYNDPTAGGTISQPVQATGTWESLPPLPSTPDADPLFNLYNPRTGEWRQVRLSAVRNASSAYDGWELEDPNTGLRTPIKGSPSDPSDQVHFPAPQNAPPPSASPYPNPQTAPVPGDRNYTNPPTPGQPAGGAESFAPSMGGFFGAANGPQPSQAWFNPTGAQPAQGLPGVAGMNPTVASLMSRYSHDPEYQQALMLASMS